MNQALKQPTEWIDEIPTRPSVFKARVVSVATAVLVGLGMGVWLWAPEALIALLSRNAGLANAMIDSGMSTALFLCFTAFGVLGVFCLLAGALSLYRRHLTYRILRATLLVVYPLVLAYVVVAWRCVSLITEGELAVDFSTYDRVAGAFLLWQVTWPALAVAAYVVWLHLLLRSRSVYAAFTEEAGEPMAGDRVLEDWRTHGHDPRARRSLYGSAFTHLMVLVIIPGLLTWLQGCVDPFSVPKGSGVEQVAMVKVQVKKKKKLLLAKNSAIIWKMPDLFEETDIDRKMDEDTSLTYVATGTPGKIGKGGGKKGGWPEGMEDAKVRFPRLNHGGQGWDDGMNFTNADVNFLREFAKVTGFKTASRGEALSARQLASLPDDGFPPFLYVTGNSDLGRMSNAERKVLREYCLKGGMLIGDAGSNRFDRSFRAFLRQVFPGKNLIDIADDDVLYQQPTSFPDGAPSFWHHGGDRALGIKHDGRWIVFYHPGDMNDAWKSRGYSDVTPQMRNNAMQLGINLVAYAFNQWNDAVARLRK